MTGVLPCSALPRACPALLYSALADAMMGLMPVCLCRSAKHKDSEGMHGESMLIWRHIQQDS